SNTRPAERIASSRRSRDARERYVGTESPLAGCGAPHLRQKASLETNSAPHLEHVMLSVPFVARYVPPTPNPFKPRKPLFRSGTIFQSPFTRRHSTSILSARLVLASSVVIRAVRFTGTV